MAVIRKLTTATECRVPGTGQARAPHFVDFSSLRPPGSPTCLPGSAPAQGSGTVGERPAQGQLLPGEVPGVGHVATQRDSQVDHTLPTGPHCL